MQQVFNQFQPGFIKKIPELSRDPKIIGRPDEEIFSISKTPYIEVTVSAVNQFQTAKDLTTF